MYPNATGSADPQLDEATYRKLIQTVCFLRQLSPLYDTEDHDSDSESNSSLEDFPETEPLPGTDAGLRQTLVDAIAFAASTERDTEHVVAVAVEELKEQMDSGTRPTGLRFRLSMNSKISGTMLSGLKDLGAILAQINTEDCGAEDAQNRVFDLIIKMKRGHLATILRGGPRPGLIKLFEHARRKLTGPGGHQYPPYSTTLKISSGEFDTNGAYTPETHVSHMKSARSYFDELDQLCTKSAKKEKEKGYPQERFDAVGVKNLILLSFEGRHSKCFPQLLTLGNESASMKLYRMLRKLSRYWQCTVDLVECARSKSLAGLFQNVEFCATPWTPAKPPTSPLPGQGQLLKFLTSLGYHEAEVLKRCASKYSRLNAEFQRLQGKDLYVHAEIGLIYYYATHPELQPAREIGCSKHACFLCDIFIKHHPDFEVRATHKKIYVGWGLPDLKGVRVRDRFSSEILQNAITKTIRDIEDAVKTEFDSPRGTQPNNLSPDSSSGVSETETVDSGTVIGSPAAKSMAESTDIADPSDLPHDRIKYEKRPAIVRHLNRDTDLDPD